MHAQSLTVQDMFQAIPGLISCARVHDWEMGTAREAVRWVVLSIGH